MKFDNGLIRKVESTFQSLLVLSLMFIISACAVVKAPTGGPKDTKGPEIIEYFPTQGSLNISPQTKIRLKFDEQINKVSLLKSVKIWPQPEKPPLIKATFTSLSIDFSKTPLDSNQTYIITIDSKFKDLQNNSLEKPFTLAFSTGNFINQGQIDGEIFTSSNEKIKGKLYLYKDYLKSIDTLITQTPQYVFEPAAKGEFSFTYLPENPMNLFYLEDANANGIIDAGDAFARPFQKAVTPGTISPPMIWMWPQIVAPKRNPILEIKKIADDLIIVRFKHIIDSESFNETQIFSNLGEIFIDGFSSVSGDENAILIDTDFPKLTASQIFSFQHLKDPTGIYLKSDTLGLKIDLKDSLLILSPTLIATSNVDEDSLFITLNTNYPFKSIIDSSFHLIQMGPDTLDYRLNFKPHLTTEFKTKIPMDFAKGRKFMWQLATNDLISKYTVKHSDTLYSGDFSIANKSELGKLIFSSEIMEQKWATLIKDKLWKKDISHETTSTFYGLDEGNYNLVIWKDSNKNKRFDSGGTDLNTVSEFFYVYPDTIHIRARWDTDLELISIQDPK
jgi:hypothetical protein